MRDYTLAAWDKVFFVLLTIYMCYMVGLICSVMIENLTMMKWFLVSGLVVISAAVINLLIGMWMEGRD
ncbi:MAG: hypothetical protein IIY21_12545 [Clostridiales bacterium]|nr:hypothetical protein [Clostridiales bacterium]